jgi:Chaperone of endosialidase
MPRNAAGTYTLPAGNPVVAGTAIEATWANTTLADIANELTNSLSREGEGGMLAPFRVFDGNAAAPGLAFLNEPSSGIYRAGSGEVWMSVLTEPVLQLTTSGVLVPTGKTFTAQGNVTIGGTLGVTGALTASGGVTGNASTATALQTARLIFGQSFNGTGNVTGDLTANGITAQAGVYVSTDINLARTGANQINGFFTTGVDDVNFRLGVSNGQAGSTGALQAAFGLYYLGSGEVANLRFHRGSSSNDGALAVATAGVERSRTDSVGNTLFGTTNATVLNTNYGTKIAAPNNPNQVAVNAADSCWDMSRQTDGNLTRHYRSGAQVGGISVTSTATAYNTSSDYRLKDNVHPMTGALARVAQLNPVTYTWKADGSAGEGFIAHELAQVVPQAVTGSKDEVDADGQPKYQGIDTSFLIGMLTAAIKELKAEFDAYKAAHP